MALTQLKVTDAGLAAIAAAVGLGESFVLSHVQFGSEQYMPDGTETSLRNPLTPNIFYPIVGNEVEATSFNAYIQDVSNALYSVGELGVWTGHDVPILFAIFSRPSAEGYVLQKAATSDVVFQLAGEIVQNFGAAITFPPATITFQENTQPQVLDFASQAEVNTGAARDKVISPLTLAGNFFNRKAGQTETNLGISDFLWVSPSKLAGKFVERMATSVEAIAGTLSNKNINPATLLAVLESRIASLPQVITGTNDRKFVTPVTLQGKLGDRIASQGEVNSGLNAIKIVTPQTLEGKFTNKRASQNEVDAGNNNSKFVTPRTLDERLVGGKKLYFVDNEASIPTNPVNGDYLLTLITSMEEVVSAGDAVTSLGFTVPTATDISGISVTSDRIYVLESPGGNGQDKVRVFNYMGVEQVTESFNLDYVSQPGPSGITVTSDTIYILDTGTFGQRIVSYDLMGNLLNDDLFRIPSQFLPRGISAQNNRLYVATIGTSKRILVYTFTGDRQNSEEFVLPSANDNGQGITVSVSRIRVVDETANKVFVYTLTGTRQINEEFLLDSDNANAEGISIFSEGSSTLYVANNGATSRSIVVYSLVSGTIGADLPTTGFYERVAGDWTKRNSLPLVA